MDAGAELLAEKRGSDLIGLFCLDAHLKNIAAIFC